MIPPDRWAVVSMSPVKEHPDTSTVALFPMIPPQYWVIILPIT